MSQRDPIIVKRQYATDEKLRLRHDIHARYTLPKKDFIEWAIKMLNLRGDERVLDVGSGPGLYYTRLHELYPNTRYVGIDLVPAMLESHGQHNDSEHRLACADVGKLPFADGQFDIVMANHMLYHVENIEEAVAEMRRVLKPGGLLMAATNSQNTMQEMQILMRRAIVLLTRQGAAMVRPPSLPSDHFSLENGTRLLSRHFNAVVRYDLPGHLAFKEVDPPIAYLESSRELREMMLPSDVQWDDVMMIMRQQIGQLIKHMGELMISKLPGLLIATDRGGFIKTYMDQFDPVETEK